MSVDGEKTSGGKALDRIIKLFDPGSFFELSGQFACGVVSGYGLSDGRLVFAYCQEGPVNLRHAEKIGELYDKAVTMGAPVVAMLDSDGLELSEGMETLSAYGKIYAAMCECSGIVPQIGIVLGKSIGSAAFIPALSDFVIACEDGAAMLLAPPSTLGDPAAKLMSAGDMGGAKILAEKAGLAHFTAKTEDDAIYLAKALLDYLPSNNLDEAPVGIFHDGGGPRGESLGEGTNINDLIASVADNNKYLEIRKDYGKSMLTCFARFNGYVAGIVCNNGKLTAEGAEKAAETVNFCDAYGIPVVAFAGADGYEFTVSGHKDQVKACAKMITAFSQATVPLVCVIYAQTGGSAYTIMNSKPLGADMTFIWDTAAVSALPRDAAKAVLGAELDDSPGCSAANGLADAVIKPSETRRMVVSALEMLSSKRVRRRDKKHGTR